MGQVICYRHDERLEAEASVFVFSYVVVSSADVVDDAASGTNVSHERHSRDLYSHKHKQRRVRTHLIVGKPFKKSSKQSPVHSGGVEVVNVEERVEA
jgi:hypothetical protein